MIRKDEHCRLVSWRRFCGKTAKYETMEANTTERHGTAKRDSIRPIRYPKTCKKIMKHQKERRKKQKCWKKSRNESFGESPRDLKHINVSLVNGFSGAEWLLAAASVWCVPSLARTIFGRHRNRNKRINPC